MLKHISPLPVDGSEEVFVFSFRGGFSMKRFFLGAAWAIGLGLSPLIFTQNTTLSSVYAFDFFSDLSEPSSYVEEDGVADPMIPAESTVAIKNSMQAFSKEDISLLNTPVTISEQDFQSPALEQLSPENQETVPQLYQSALTELISLIEESENAGSPKSFLAANPSISLSEEQLNSSYDYQLMQLNIKLQTKKKFFELKEILTSFEQSSSQELEVYLSEINTLKQEISETREQTISLLEDNRNLKTVSDEMSLFKENILPPSLFTGTAKVSTSEEQWEQNFLKKINGSYEESFNAPSNPVHWQYDQSYSLVGAKVSLLENNIQAVEIKSNYVTGVQNRYNPGHMDKSFRELFTSRMRNAVHSKKLSSSGSYVVHSLVRDNAGNPIAVALAANTHSQNLYLVPVPNPGQSQVFHVESPKIPTPKSPSFDMNYLKGLLSSIIEKTKVGHPGNKEEAQAIKTLAHKFYQAMHDNREMVLAENTEKTNSLYSMLREAQNLFNLWLNNSSSEEKDRFEIGTSQNCLAICASMLGEIHNFENSKNKPVGNYILDLKTVRIGNFYDRGTNDLEEVQKQDDFMSGHYSLTAFQARSWQQDITLDAYYSGLNPSGAGNLNTNDYNLYVLDPNHKDLNTFKTCISSLVKFTTNLGQTGYYKKPASECMEEVSDSLFISDSHRTVDGVEGQSKGFLNPITLKAPEDGKFLVYQEAAGLKWAQPWVDYDEATMTVGIRLRELKTIPPENWRIVIDGSGTMKGLFEKVASALQSEFRSPVLASAGMGNASNIFLFGCYNPNNAEQYVKAGIWEKPWKVLGANSSNPVGEGTFHYSRGPISIEQLTKEQPMGPSPVIAGIKKLLDQEPGTPGAIPDAPWTLLIISDFDDKDNFFNYENWISREELGAPLFKNNGYIYEINQNGPWSNLQEIHLVTVEKIMNGRPPKSWLTDEGDISKGFQRGDGGIYIFHDEPNFSAAISRFMEPIKEGLRKR
jgi:hypothetical protein